MATERKWSLAGEWFSLVLVSYCFPIGLMDLFHFNVVIAFVISFKMGSLGGGGTPLVLPLVFQLCDALNVLR